jgi:hypothetical protein
MASNFCYITYMNTKPIPSIVPPAGMSEKLYQELLHSRANRIENEDESAIKTESLFLPNSVLWRVFSQPGSLDIPEYYAGMQNNTLYILHNLEDAVHFYQKI